MSILTIAWSMVTAMSLGLGMFSLLIWLRWKGSTAHLFFAVAAFGAGIFAISDLASFHAHSLEALITCLKWANLGVYLILIGLVWFTHYYFRTARFWLAATITGIWSILLIINFMHPNSLVYDEISGIQTFTLPWGEEIPLLSGTRNIWSAISDLVSLMIMVFFIDASIRLWKNGGRKRAGIIGGSIILFMTLAGIHTPLVDTGVLSPPYLIAFAYLFIIAAMAIEMSYDIIRTAELAKSLQSQRQRWQNLLENVQSLIVGLDIEGKINYINPYFLKFCGYESSDICGKDWFDQFIAENERRDLRRQFGHMINGTGQAHYQNSIRIKGGEMRNIHWSNVLLHDEDENVTGTISIGSDMTDYIKARDEILSLKERIEEENIYLREEILSENHYRDIIGQSDVLKYALARIEQVAKTDMTVLLEGETGVGKELFARAIHYASRRKNRPLVKLNCAAIPLNLLESELFGHEKGAFTGAHKQRKGRFELADGGSLFLDEIGELPLEMQAKLLHVLEEGRFERVGGSQSLKVDVRIIAATNRHLLEDVQAGRFREDFYYRINAYQISIPPLRKRTEDIPLLVEYFVGNFCRKTGKKISKIPKSTLNSLTRYHWPGNIRELRNVLERAVMASGRDKLILADSLQSEQNESARIYREDILSMDEMERRHIMAALDKTNGRISGSEGAAEILHMHPNTLRNRMQKLGINKQD